MIHAGGGAKAGGGRKQKVCGEQRGLVVRDEHGSFQSASKQCQMSLLRPPPIASTIISER